MNVLEMLRERLRLLEPGKAIEVDPHLLDQVDAPPPWEAADWVLEGIVGAAYEYQHWVNPHTRTLTYHRLPEPTRDGLRCFVSADRAHLFRRRPDGLYEFNR